MKISLILLGAAILCFQAPVHNCLGEGNNVARSTPKKSRVERIDELREAQDKKMNFYGVVIDQKGEPVPDAEVSIGVRHSLYRYYR